jgi:antitoxin HigA-1
LKREWAVSRKKDYPPTHPGEILLEEFMEPLGLSQNALARALAIDPARINEIVRGKRSISADTALRLARYFGTTPELWMNLQSRYDLQMAKEMKASEIENRVQARPKGVLSAPA